MSMSYLAIDLTTTSADDALALARETFPDHEITLDRIDADDWLLDAFGLGWVTEYGSDYGILINYDRGEIVTLCGDCAYWLDHGSESLGPDFTPSESLKALANSGLSDMLVFSESAGYCAGCETYCAYRGGGWYYARQN